MQIEQIKQMEAIDKVIIHSFECSVYLVSVIVAGEEHYVKNKEGEPLKSRNKIELLNIFNPQKVKRAVLRQQSAYDEMVGHNYATVDNTLEVPMSLGES